MFRISVTFPDVLYPEKANAIVGCINSHSHDLTKLYNLLDKLWKQNKTISFLGDFKIDRLTEMQLTFIFK